MEAAVKDKISICWLRRDLRLEDNAALFHALKSPYPVLVFFIFDRNILSKLPSRKDARVEFILRQLSRLSAELQQKGSSLLVHHEKPKKAFLKLFSEFDVQAIFTNSDYEPYAWKRDSEIAELCSENGVGFESFKDQVIFEKDEILKSDGSPYTVFTPYSKRWKRGLLQEGIPEYDTKSLFGNFLKISSFRIPTLEEIGFQPSGIEIPKAVISEEIISSYEHTRNLPALEGTSKLGIHLRFGTLSIRKTVKAASEFSEKWLDELIWREFFMMILYRFPEVENKNFRRKYDRLEWRNNEEEFQLWCRGETGFPLIDAGMRQLNETGWMHNRVRMLVSGFLTKHLLIDWRWGEAYFAEKLFDYELASNNGNWQWAAGTGCDAAPYFRIFNPDTQLKKFDPQLKYVKTWIKDFRAGYLEPIVDHKFARARALETYKKVLKS